MFDRSSADKRLIFLCASNVISLPEKLLPVTVISPSPFSPVAVIFRFLSANKADPCTLVPL
jgi:hypothetical protein